MAATAVQKSSTPPIAQRGPPSEVQASQPVAQAVAVPAPTKTAPNGPKSGRVQPAVPLQSPSVAKAPLRANPANTAPQASSQSNNASLKDSTQAAAAAVAGAMARALGSEAPQQANGDAIDNLTKKVQDMRTNDSTRNPRQPTAGGFTAGRGRGRGGPRGGAQKVEVPTTDFDFESSNAKFNKQDLVKEAIAGSPPIENPPASLNGDAEDDSEKHVSSYNKSTSFFDNISSESKDRAEAMNKPGGREWRGEEQKKNVETFGQGSVDNGYRGGFRGRGRGRGPFRGRGFNQNGRGAPRGGSFRGGRGGFETGVLPDQQ